MNMDLSRFKKIKEDKNSALLQHPAGHRIQIAKHALNPRTKKELDRLPIHAAEGVDVPDPKDEDQKAAASAPEQATPEVQAPAADKPETAAPEASNAPQSPPPATINIFNGQGNAQPQTQAPMPPQGQVAPAAAAPIQAPMGHLPDGLKQPSAPAAPEASQQAQAQPSMDDAMMGAYNQGFGNQMKGLQQEAAATGALGKAQAEVYNQSIAQQQKAQQSYQDHYDALEKERQAFQKDIQDQHIDPNRYMNGMGTGQRIASAIGLLLSGLGAGVAGQSNMMNDYLNDQINRDIDAQKTDLGKKKNLLQANMQQFGNLRDATEMTRVMMGDIVSNQLKMEAAKAASPMAQAKLMQEAGKLQLQMAPIIQQMAMRKMMMSAGNSMGGSGGSAGAPSAAAGSNPTAGVERDLNYLRMANPEMAKSLEQRVVPSVGVASIPVPDDIRQKLIARQSLNNAIADLQKFAEEHSGTILDREVVNEGIAKAALVQDNYRRGNDQGVFRQGEKEFVNGIIGEDPTQFFGNFRSQPRYKALASDNMAQLNQIKKMYGLPEQYMPPSSKPYQGKK